MKKLTHGQKIAATNLKRYGDDFYKRIGAMGGMASTDGGFASIKVGIDGMTGPERARIVGAKGGTISRRSSVSNG